MKFTKENVSDWICQDEDEYVKGIFVDEYQDTNGETVYSVMLELANGHRVKIQDFYYPDEKWLKERDNQKEHNQNVQSKPNRMD